LNIGRPISADGWGIYTNPMAREQARRLQRLIDEGKDPRRERADQEASDRAVRDAGSPWWRRLGSQAQRHCG